MQGHLYPEPSAVTLMLFSRCAYSALLCLTLCLELNAGLIWSEDFEIPDPDVFWGFGSEYEAEGYHFIRSSDPSLNGDGSNPYSGYHGSAFFSALNLDASGNGAFEPDYRGLVSPLIDTSSYEDLSFSGLFAAGDSINYERFDWLFLAVSYDEGSSWEKLLQFNAIDLSLGSGMGRKDAFSPLSDVSDPFADEDDHEVGAEMLSTEGKLGAAFQEVSLDLADSNSIQLFWGTHVDSSDEYAATDYWRVQGNLKTSSVPEPATYGIGAAVFLGFLIGLRRTRRRSG